MTVLEKDIQEFAESFALTEYFRNSHVIVTGSTGLIGSILVKCLLKLNSIYGLGISIICPVRNIRKVWDVFGDLPLDAQVEWLECEDLSTCDYSGIETVDYVFHLASPTASKFFTEHPVETLATAFLGTYNLLQWLREKQELKGFVYVSSLESYGSITDGGKQAITEDSQGYVNPLEARSCYPMGKRAVENLCHDFACEYGMPTKIARLTQTFGAGVATTDNRVFAQFARSIINGTDIVLHTTGESAKPYVYTTDCIAALIQIAVFGNAGEAYNVANAETYISIREMAELLRDNFNPKVEVRVELHPEMGYAPITQLPLSTDRLLALGWQPKVGLVEMFRRLIVSLQ